mgnify:CR=1 FL=1
MIKTHVETDPKYNPVKNEVISDGVFHLFNSKDILSKSNLNTLSFKVFNDV